jgi:hypothetical protein
MLTLPIGGKMKPIEVIEAKRQHLRRLATQSGAAGELGLLSGMSNWIARPRGKGLSVLLNALRASGVTIKGSSFDAIAMSQPGALDFTNDIAVQTALPDMVFIEIKTASQQRVGTDFSGFFFALTESEITAAEVLGPRHRVALYNKLTGHMMLTSVPEIVSRAKSTNWQLSVQL